MKISLDFDDNDVVFEVMDAMFVAYLKNFRKDCAQYIGEAWNEEDRFAYEELTRACDVILQHFGAPHGDDTREEG